MRATLPAPCLKQGLVALAAVGLVGALGWALWPKPVPVELAEARKGPLTVTVEEEGKTRIKDVYAVSAPITGKLVRLALEAGDRVMKDVTVVAVIEPMAPPFLDVRTTRELEAQIEAAKAAVALADAEVSQAAAELAFAESELKRAGTLIGSRTVSERTLERARIDVDTRRAALARAKANLEVRKRELESGQARLIGPEEQWKGEVAVGCCVNVRAPASGRVLRLIQESERVVSAGTPVVEIGDPANLEIVVELLSVDAVKVREGAMASIEGWGGPALAAKVTRVEPAGFTKVSALGIEEQRVRTILQLQNGSQAADQLGHDFRVFVKITVYEAPNALRVPISALFRKRDQWTVYRVRERAGAIGRGAARPAQHGIRRGARRPAGRCDRGVASKRSGRRWRADNADERGSLDY